MRRHSPMVMKQESVSVPLVYGLVRRMIKLWDGLPVEVVEETSDSSFERKLVDHKLGRWQALCN